MTDYAKKSLEGVWVGDCIGNLGQLYFVHDILKALEGGLAKFGSQLNQFSNNFQYSDDTEEAIVLYNHLLTNGDIIQDKLALEFATRYMDRDPDGEIYGYGLNTRKVLRDIYEGVPWKDANKIIKKSEGMPSHIDSLVHSLSTGENIRTAMSAVNRSLNSQRAEQIGKVKEGSCGNGSAMRVAPLGAFFAGKKNLSELREITTLSAEVTHCHPEGVAGAIAISVASYYVTRLAQWGSKLEDSDLLNTVYFSVPDGEVRNGIERAKQLSLDAPIGKAREVLGNGTHVTCQDTVPLCCWLAHKALKTYTLEEMYERSIIETSMAFGDVDTNCAIVGGILGVVSPPPQKWIQFCQSMEGVQQLELV